MKGSSPRAVGGFAGRGLANTIEHSVRAERDKMKRCMIDVCDMLWAKESRGCDIAMLLLQDL